MHDAWLRRLVAGEVAGVGPVGWPKPGIRFEPGRFSPTPAA